MLGRHLLLDIRGVHPDKLRFVADIRPVLLHAAQAGHCTVLAENFHQFSPEGATGILLLAESHLSIHTWPELGSASIDAYTCGDSVDMDALESALLETLVPAEISRRFIIRE